MGRDATMMMLSNLAPSSPPSRPLRAASGGGLRPALTAAASLDAISDAQRTASSRGYRLTSATVPWRPVFVNA